MKNYFFLENYVTSEGVVSLNVLYYQPLPNTCYQVRLCTHHTFSHSLFLYPFVEEYADVDLPMSPSSEHIQEEGELEELYEDTVPAESTHSNDSSHNSEEEQEDNKIGTIDLDGDPYGGEPCHLINNDHINYTYSSYTDPLVLSHAPFLFAIFGVKIIHKYVQISESETDKNGWCAF